jgi:RecB family exonuclease
VQQRTLLRARRLSEFRAALVTLCLEGDPLAARRRIVIVPTQAAGELLRQTVEAAAADDGRSAVFLPDFVTRDEWLMRLHASLVPRAPLLSRLEREILLERAARETADRRRFGLPFDLRPGLVAAMLGFYDELRRRQRTVRRFARALFDDLRVERGTDRGSEGLIQQTCFLGLAFLAYSRAVAASGALDEHMLAARVRAEQPTLDVDHLVVAVADHPADPRGLWPSDFDLIGRLRTLPRVDVVVTDEIHDAGFRERMEHELPGIVEARVPPREAPSAHLLRPPGDPHLPVFVSRDREEELRDIARAIRAAAVDGRLRNPVAVVFQRPLPYLYLARQIFDDARVPYQALDALPLAAEPYAALLDLVLTAARADEPGPPALALLRSSSLEFADAGGHTVSRTDAAVLERVLTERRALGCASPVAEIEAFFGEAAARRGLSRASARRAAEAMEAAHAELEPFRTGGAASLQVGALRTFLDRHDGGWARADDWARRHRRARAGVLALLQTIVEACAAHDDRPRDRETLTALVHHALEAHTFAPKLGDAGVHLVDAVAARFGAFDRVYLVGLVETEWPERMRRNVFYGAGLLKALGWPQDGEHARAEQATFRDLLELAARETRLSAFQFEGDAMTALSPMLESTVGLPAVEADPLPAQPLFADELLTYEEVPAGLEADVAVWSALRRSRPALTDRRYAGFVSPQAPQAYRISRVDRYIDCPFKYFAESVLRLPDDREAESGLSPLERGTLLHELFERFYAAWQKDGYGAITMANLPDALQRFTALTHDVLNSLPSADRVLEEARLLGSIVSRGVAERVFELEIDAGVEVESRLLEYELRGTFSFPRPGHLTVRDVEIHGKADRIDVLQDGSLRVVDYKLGRMPEVESSIQIAVYAHAARQRLEATDGRAHPIAMAHYLAFGDDRRLEGRLADRAEETPLAVDARVQAFTRAVEQIEAGEFPPRPRRVAECAWCRFSGVCRKEYLVDDDEAADAV